MDIYMPILNGYAASQEIRKLEEKYQTRERLFICAYSSQVSQSTEKKCFDNGMDDIIAKPMSSEILTRMLREHDRRHINGK